MGFLLEPLSKVSMGFISSCRRVAPVALPTIAVLAALCSGCAADQIAVVADLGNDLLFRHAEEMTVTAHAPRDEQANDADACEEILVELRSPGGFSAEPEAQYGPIAPCDFRDGIVLESLPTGRTHLVLAVDGPSGDLLAFDCITTNFDEALPEQVTFVTENTSFYRTQVAPTDPPFATVQERCGTGD